MATNASSVTCFCTERYFGEGCQYSNACSDMPCQNGGICMVNLLTASQYTCMCPDGFEGARCEVAESPCASSPCQNQGSCTDFNNGTFECRCAPGYAGRLCETNVDDCASSPCVNGACIDLVNSFMCDCPPAFSGPLCSSRVVFCSSDPCLNGGTCDEGEESFVCSCPSGYTGVTCEQDIDECTVSPSGPCLNGGTCANRQGGFVCFCPPGFTNVTCEVEIDFCLSSPCSSNGTSACRSQLSGFQCDCRAGYTGELCEVELDPCNPNPCFSGTCVRTDGSFMCVCPFGLTGQTCNIDLDDCASSPCVNNGTCEDMTGNFTCTCPPEYTGTTCGELVNFCNDQSCFNGGTCTSGVGTFSCSCVSGWSGDRCQFSDGVVAKLSSCRFPGASDMLQELFLVQNNEPVPVQSSLTFTFRYQLTNANGIYMSGWIWQEENTNSVVFSFRDSPQSTAALVSNLPSNELLFSYSSTGVDLQAVFRNVPLRGNSWMHLAVAIFNDSVKVNIDGTFNNETRLQGTGAFTVPQSIVLNIGAGGSTTATAFSGLVKGIAVNNISNSSGSFDLQALQACTVGCVGGDSFCSANGQCRDLFGADRICSCSFGYTGLLCQGVEERISFDGSSFAVLNELPPEPMTSLQFSFKTGQARGVLYSVSQPLVQSTLKLQDTRTVRLDHESCNGTTEMQQLASTTTDLNTTQYQSVAVSNVLELNSNDRLLVSTPDIESCNQTFSSRMILGGLPGETSYNGFQGCMKDIFYNRERVDSSRLLLSEGAQFGCSHDTARFYYFSHLELPQFISRQFQQVSLEFSTHTSDGLIYFSRRLPDDASGNMPNDFIAIYIQDSRAVFSFNLGEQNQAVVLRGGASISDGQWHRLVATQNGTVASLYLDGSLMEEQSLGPLMLLDTTGSVFVGGVSSGNRIRTFQNYEGFNGCVRDVEQNGRMVDLQSHLSQLRVQFGVCN